MTAPSLFQPLTLGDLTLPNRIVMAPLTRNRALHDGDIPNPLAAEYYAQRATAGLIIAEASQINPAGKGYAWTPGIYNDAQVAGWRQITQAVHAAGGRIFLQLWHVGRISHKSLQPGGAAPVAPSAIQAQAQTFDGTGMVPVSAPRALSLGEIEATLADYARAAQNAKDAGFDGVELHAANGYLIDQFLQSRTNQRTDAYGGSLENRTRFLARALAALTSVWAPGRVGVRFSPFSTFNDIADDDPMATFAAAIDVAAAAGVGYLHLVEGTAGATRDLPAGASIGALRARFPGHYMANNGYDRALAMNAVAEGSVDLVAFGRPFIANPDLVARLRADAQMNPLDPTTLYGGGAKGYTDYPALDTVA